MNDTSTKRITETKTIVKCSSLGQPMAALADHINKAVLGRIIGYGIRTGHEYLEDSQTGEVKDVRHLVGSFMAIPRDEKRPRVQSSKLGLPEHIGSVGYDFFETSGEKLREYTKKNVGQMLYVAFDIGVERAKNPAGYSWFGIPLIEPGADDPLALLEQRLATGEPVAALASPTDAEIDKADEQANEAIADVEAERPRRRRATG